MNALTHAHSGFRWIILALFLYAIFNAVSGKSSGREYLKKDKMINLFTMISVHLMITVGLILLFTSAKVDFSHPMGNKMLRFYTVEHPFGMITAMILVTMGRKKAENASSTPDKFKHIIKWYSFALLIILATIPWPFRGLGGSWA